MKLAIMGAMQEEIAPLLDLIGEYEEISYADNTYYTCKYASHDIVIAYSKIGKVFSALTASVMVQKFGAEILLFSGVAGAISRELKVGDLIAATKLAQHDLDITAFGHPFGYVPEGAVYIEANRKLLATAQEVASSLGVTLREGIIATGDQFVADEERKDWIGTTFNADALEMEGASVAVVCDAFDIPFFILRAISDAADMDASFSFDAFLESSAKESAKFMIKMVDALGETL